MKKRITNLRFTALLSVCLAVFGINALLDRSVAAQQRRPMTFMDVMEMRSTAAPAISPDGKWALYALNVPDWKAARSFTDIYLVSTEIGSPSTRQMTFTKDKNETSPRWSRDGR